LSADIITHKFFVIDIFYEKMIDFTPVKRIEGGRMFLQIALPVRCFARSVLFEFDFT